MEENKTQLQERDAQISQQQRELDALRANNPGHKYCVVVVTSQYSLCFSILGGGKNATSEGGRW